MYVFTFEAINYSGLSLFIYFYFFEKNLRGMLFMCVSIYSETNDIVNYLAHVMVSYYDVSQQI